MPGVRMRSEWLFTFPQEVFDRLENVFFAVDAGGDQLVLFRHRTFQFADELTASVGAIDLTVAKQVHSRQDGVLQ